MSGLLTRLGSDTLKYLPAVVIPAVVAVLHIAIFTRAFSPGPYGEYSLVYVVVSIATSILAGWLQQSVLRYLPKFRAEGRLEEFLAKLGTILWVVAILILLVGLAVHRWVQPALGAYGRYYIPAVVWVIAGLVFFVQNHAFRPNLQSAKFSRYQVLYAVGRLAFALVLVYFVSKDVIGLIIGASVAYIVLLWPMKTELGLLLGKKPSGVSIDFSLLRRFLGYGFPVIGWVLGVKVLDLSDRFIIELFRESGEVGIYSANYSLVTMGVMFVATPLLSAAAPLIMNAWEEGHQARIRAVISDFSRYYLLSAVPVVAFAIVFGREIVTVFLGEEYREGHTIIPYILLGSLVWNFAMYGHKGIKLLEKTRIMMLLVTICCAVNIALNLVFVPRYGYHGAAVTTFVSFALYPVMVYFVTKRFLPWAIPWRSALKIVFATAGASAGWWGVRWALDGKVHVVLILVIAFAAGLAVYVGMLAITRELRDYERRLITLRRRH